MLKKCRSKGLNSLQDVGKKARIVRGLGVIMDSLASPPTARPP